MGSCSGQSADNSLHSDIFVVNSTSESLNVQVEQTGDAPLLENEDYIVYENTIPPFATKHILRVNRQRPIASGQEFFFSTRLENAKVNVQLDQKMQSLESDSILSFGATINSVATPLQTGLAIYRTPFNQTDNLIGELAYSASNKAIYPDIHYVVTEAYPPAILSPSSEELSLITYNIWALPYISNKIKERLQAMPPFLAQYDVLLLQEAFAPERDRLIATLEEDYGYSYVSNILNNPTPNFFDGGIVLLSRYPIVNQAQFYFPDCNGAECFTDKGINYIEIIKQGRSYHIFSAHTSSFNNDIARLYRQNQFEQMRAFAESLNIPQNEPVIYGGDFNVNKSLFPEDYQQMLTTLDASEPNFTGYTDSTFDPFININATAFGTGGDQIEYLDYVLVSNRYAEPNSNINHVRVPRSTAPSLWRLWDLSDHFPVEAFIK
jgi:endonuclease/exonuclease/phosphatase family metal-dependent hydrolase